MSRRLACWILLVLLNSCSVLPTTQRPEQSELIPMAQPLGPTRRVVQQITATWPGHQETLLCVLELNNHHIAIAGLSADGISLFNLSYDGKKVVLDKSPMLPDNFSPEMIIKDLQLVYWPLPDIQKILPKQWRMETDSHQRHYYFNNERQVDIVYLQPDVIWPKTVSLTNYRYHYQLHIKTISYESVPE